SRGHHRRVLEHTSGENNELGRHGILARSRLTLENVPLVDERAQQPPHGPRMHVERRGQFEPPFRPPAPPASSSSARIVRTTWPVCERAPPPALCETDSTVRQT